MTDNNADPSGQSGGPAPGGQSGSGSGPNPGGQSGSGSGPNPGGQGDGEAKFTQADVTRIVGREVGEATAKFSDYDDLKKRLADIENQGKTELQRVTDEKATAEAQRAEAIVERNRLLVQSTVGSAAHRAGATDPDVVVALLAPTLTVDDKGALSGDVEAMVKKLLEEKPFLAGKPAGNGHGDIGGGAHGGGSPGTGASMDDILRRGTSR